MIRLGATQIKNNIKMKSVIILFLLGLIVTWLLPNNNIVGQSLVLQDIVMCSTLMERETTGKCTGLASCRVCTDCSRCQYCNSGGSCGICSNSSPRAIYQIERYSNSVNSTRTTNPDNLMSDQPNSEYYLRTLYVVDTEFLNLRAGPGSNYKVIERLPKMTKLYFWAIENGWVKVTVQSTEVVGYVYYNYVVVE